METLHLFKNIAKYGVINTNLCNDKVWAGMIILELILKNIIGYPIHISYAHFIESKNGAIDCHKPVTLTYVVMNQSLK